MTLFSPKSKAFSLVEITISLGIMAFCLLAIFGLLPVGLTSNANSVTQTKAAGVASGVVADLRAAPSKASAKSPRYSFDVPITGGNNTMTNPQTIFTQEDGTPTGLIGTKASRDPLNQSTFRVTVGCAPPSPSKGATMARIMVTWPAFADEAKDPSSKNWPTNQTGQFETVIAINRN